MSDRRDDAGLRLVTPPPADGAPSRLANLVLPAALACWMIAVAVLGTDAAYLPATLVALVGLYVLLALGLHAALVAARGLGRWPAWLVAWGIGGVLVWTLREATFWPSQLVLVPVLALVPAPLLARAATAAARGVPWRRAAAAWLVLVLALPLALAAAARASNDLRWHLLRHNKSLGTPYYYLFLPTVRELEARLFARHRDETPPADLAQAPLPSPSTTPATPAPRPHVVFVMLDTLRADALTAWAEARPAAGDRAPVAGAMPRLDARLAGAYRLLDVTANSSWTRPSIASMITGLLPEEHGARDLRDPLEERFVTLAERYRAAGYETAAFVTNFGAVGGAAGFAQGFEHFVELETRPYTRARGLGRLVERWLAGRATSHRPLFLYLHYLDPHEPYLAGVVPRRKSYNEYVAAYRAELAYLDRELDALLDRLAAALPGAEVVVVASDHGEEFGEHDEFGHGQSLYRELVHVPVAVDLPGDDGGDVTARLEGRDLHDLLARLAVGPVDVPAWAERRSRARRQASVSYTGHGRLTLRPYLAQVAMRAVEEGGRKLVWSAYGDTWELYDTDADPGELRNRAAVEPALRDRLAARLGEDVRYWTFPQPYERSEREHGQLRALGYAGD